MAQMLRNDQANTGYNTRKSITGNMIESPNFLYCDLTCIYVCIACCFVARWAVPLQHYQLYCEVYTQYTPGWLSCQRGSKASNQVLCKLSAVTRCLVLALMCVGSKFRVWKLIIIIRSNPDDVLISWYGAVYRPCYAYYSIFAKGNVRSITHGRCAVNQVLCDIILLRQRSLLWVRCNAWSNRSSKFPIESYVTSK